MGEYHKMLLIWLISMLLSFILYWIFGDIVLFITILGVAITVYILKGIKKQSFIYLEVILLVIYGLLSLLCLIFPSAITLKVLVIILGVWFMIYIYAYKRLS